VVGVTEDLIAQYLAQLRAGLRTPPERTEQILAEAEDHLRSCVRTGGRRPPCSPRSAWP
jgi:hypothetical protein